MPSIQGRDNELYGRGTNLFIISILFATAAGFLVLSRLVSRVTTARQLGLDDYAITLSMVSIRRCLEANSRPAYPINLADLANRSSQSHLPFAIASVSIG